MKCGKSEAWIFSGCTVIKIRGAGKALESHLKKDFIVLSF